MKFLMIAILMSLSFTASACLNLKAFLKVNGEELKIDQKVDYNETYSFMKGPYIINVRMAQGPKADSHLINVDVDRRDEKGLTSISRAKMAALDNQEAEMTSVSKDSQDSVNFKLTLKRI